MPEADYNGKSHTMWRYHDGEVNEAVFNLSKACAIVYDTRLKMRWGDENSVKKCYNTLLQVGITNEDILSVRSSTYFEFSKRIFEKLGFSTPSYMKYNLLIHRMGPDEADKIKLKFLDKYIQKNKERIVGNDVYDVYEGYTITSTGSGVEIRLNINSCFFKYGNIEFEFPYEKVETWTSLKLKKPEVAIQENVTKKEISPEFKALAQKFLQRELDPYEFEKFVGKFFETLGWKVEVDGRPGRDEGIDGKISFDLPGMQKELMFILQAKRYYTGKKVGAPIVRELWGTVELNHAEGGVIATTGEFVSGVCDEFEKEGLRVEFYDGDTLKELTKQILEKGYAEVRPTKRVLNEEQKMRALGELLAMTYSRLEIAEDAIRGELECNKPFSEINPSIVNKNIDNPGNTVDLLCLPLGELAKNLRYDRFVKSNRKRIKEVLEKIDTFPIKYKTERLLDLYYRIKFLVE